VTSKKEKKEKQKQKQKKWISSALPALAARNQAST
jgi:hypothetical protein